MHECLVVCVCVAHVAAAQSGWLNALKLRWRCLKFGPDLIQGNSTEARDLSRDVQKQLFGFHSPSVGIFFTRLYHTAARFETINLCAQRPDVRSIYFPRLCLEFYQPYCVCVSVCVIQTAPMHLDTEAFKNYINYFEKR